MNELSAIIYIHPTGCGAFSPMLNDYQLEWVVGAPVEDMLATLQLLKKDIPQKYPNLKFHIAHLGGGISFQMQRIIDNYTDWGSFHHHPLETLQKHFWFDTANFLEESLLHSSKILGNKRLLLGSDFPYFQNDKYTRAVTYVENAALTDQEKADILVENASNLYKDRWENVLKTKRISHESSLHYKSYAQVSDLYRGLLCAQARASYRAHPSHSCRGERRRHLHQKWHLHHSSAKSCHFRP